jgi:lysozyme
MFSFVFNLFNRQKKMVEEKPIEYDIFGLIKKHEGFSNTAYKCPAGVWTVGYGTTYYPDGTKVKKGDIITVKEAENLLAWYCLNEITLPKGTFNPKQKMALFSLIYNIGQGAFDKSNCKKAIEKEDWQVAYLNWDWTKANGKELAGLVKRRNEEKQLFFEGLL